MSTHALFRVNSNYSGAPSPPPNITNTKIHMYRTTEVHPALWYLDWVLLVFFLCELVFRFLICPDKVKFFKSKMNIIDILSVFPAMILALVDLRHARHGDGQGSIQVKVVLSIVNSLRVLRLYKLVKNIRSLRILLLALQASVKELILLCVLVFMGSAIFACSVYFAEFHVDGNFNDIPRGFWWAIITMTTVGYGDTLPESFGGRVVGGMCALAGVLVIGLPVPIIASKFNFYYSYARALIEKEKVQLKRERRKSTVNW